jgi:hypothetical protein
MLASLVQLRIVAWFQCELHYPMKDGKRLSKWSVHTLVKHNSHPKVQFSKLIIKSRFWDISLIFELFRKMKIQRLIFVFIN